MIKCAFLSKYMYVVFYWLPGSLDVFSVLYVGLSYEQRCYEYSLRITMHLCSVIIPIRTAKNYNLPILNMVYDL